MKRRTPHPQEQRAIEAEREAAAEDMLSEGSPSVEATPAEPATAGSAPPVEPAATEAERRAGEVEALQMQLLRLRADFDNFRKRVNRERAEASQRANEELLGALLPALDHLEMGLETARQHKTDAAVLNGLQLVYDQVLAVLSRFGLTPIDAAGEAFNPHRHEAASHVPSAEHPENTIVTQTRRGYRLGDKLLRPAQVVVSSGPADEPGAKPEQDI